MKFINAFKKAAGWFFVVVLIFAMSLILYSSDAAQSVRRVVFADGKNTFELCDSAKLGERDTYVLKLKKGENCEVEVEWEGDDLEDEEQALSGFSLIFPDGEARTDAQDGFIQARQAGIYKVVVSPKTRKTNYRYRIIFKRDEQ